MSYSSKLDSEGISSIGLCFTPSISTSFSLSDNISISPFIGPYVSYTFNDDYYEEKGNGSGWQGVFLEESFDIGLCLGIKLHVNDNWFIDTHYKRGFASIGECRDCSKGYADWIDIKAQKIVFGIGYKF